MKRRSKLILVAISIAVIAAIVTHQGASNMSWKEFKGSVKGVKVDGDSTMPATKWYNWAFLAWFRWNKVAVLRVPESAKDGFRVGYVPVMGKAMFDTNIKTGSTFSMKEGREPCTFFALDLNGNEIPIELVIETRVY